jgi:starch synthase (maltosyl-transferring)
MQTAQNDIPSGPRIYNLFPTLLGPIPKWHGQLPAIADMGFDWIFLNPFHLPGSSGSLYAVKDDRRLHPLLRPDDDTPADTLLSDFTAAAHEAGLRVMVDLVINHTAKDGVLVDEHPEWFARDENGDIRSPSVTDLDDPDKVTVWEDLAELDYRERPERDAMLSYWQALIGRYVALGFDGFRCDAAYKLPGEIWRGLIEAAHGDDADVRFFAETLGAPLEDIEQLRPAGFDYLFNSAKWWDFRSDWLLEQYEQFRHLAPSIAFPESHDTERLAAQSDGSERESRFRYLFAAVFSAGVMMPIGYELGFRRPLHVVETSPEDWAEQLEEPDFDISAFVGRVNAMKRDTRVLNEEGPQQGFTEPDANPLGLLRRSRDGQRRCAVLINPHRDDAARFPRAALADALGCASDALHEITPLDPQHATPPGARPQQPPSKPAHASQRSGRNRPDGDASLELAPRSLRIFLPGDGPTAGKPG